MLVFRFPSSSFFLVLFFLSLLSFFFFFFFFFLFFLSSSSSCSSSCVSVAMMLRHSLQLGAEAKVVEDSVGAALADGLRTRDLARRNEKVCGTADFGNAVQQHVLQRMGPGSAFQQQRRGYSTSARRPAAAQPRTLFDKIWDSHVIDTQPDGTCLLYIDRHLVHEVTSPQAFEGLRMAGRKVRQTSRTLATADHNVPTADRAHGISDPESRLQVHAMLL